MSHPTNDRYATANDEIFLIIWDNVEQRLLYAGGTGAIRGNVGFTNVNIAVPAPSDYSLWVAYRHPRGIFTSGALYDTNNASTGIVTPTSEFLFEFAKKMKIDVSNIDTTMDEVSAVAVLKEAIKEKAAMNEVTIRSEGEIDVIPTPDKHPYTPEGLDILAEKESFEVDYEQGEMDRMNPMSKRGTTRGNK